MRAVIGEILPLALVVTMSPLNIIPAILLLFGRRPVIGALTFLVGFTAGVAVMLGLFVVLAGAVDLSDGSGHGSWAGWVKLGLGVYLVMAAVRKYRGRPKAGAEGALPAWMDGVAAAGTARALGMGAVLGACNPKNLVVGLAAAVAVSAAELPAGQQVISCAAYVAVAVLGVAVPILVVPLLGSRAPDVLRGWNAWLRHNNATVMAVLFLVLGGVLIGQGAAGLSGH